MIELERTFLAKELPAGLETCASRDVVDVYIPRGHPHPTLRLRKSGDRYEMTKKEPLAGDASAQKEQTIILRRDEFEALRQAGGKVVQKIRYSYLHQGRTCDIDVFQGPLRGLVLVDVEFPTAREKASFEMPAFCLAEVTKETFLAGGMLCGKSYQEIEKGLARFGYRKLI